MKKIDFYKYHCLGNSFLVIDLIGRKPGLIDHGNVAKKICDRNRGVGADGILLISKSRKYEYCLDIYNADGSWAEKSGNGLRIAAAYLTSHYKAGRKIAFETKVDNPVAGIIKSGKRQFLVKVSLGLPNFDTKKIPMKSEQPFHINQPVKIDGREFILTALSIGNPHAVLFVDNFEFDWKFLGGVIENSTIFPNRTNVEFAKIINRSKIILHDWERGAGATGSSGTGAGAAVTAGIMNGFLNRTVEVVFPTGSLYIEWASNDNNIFLTGPVEFVCQGQYMLN